MSFLLLNVLGISAANLVMTKFEYWIYVSGRLPRQILVSIENFMVAYFFPKLIKTNFLLAPKKLLTIFSVLNHNKNQNNIQYSGFKHRHNQIGWWHATDKKNRQNIVETFCYLKVRLYNHEVHDFSILYETVFFACYTSQICTVTGYQFSENPFCLPIYLIICLEILHGSTAVWNN